MIQYIVKYITYKIIIVVLSALLLLSLIIFTAPGIKVILWSAVRISHISLNYQHVTGSLFNGFSLHSVKLKNQGTTVIAKKLSVQPHFFLLHSYPFSIQVNVQQAQLEHLGKTQVSHLKSLHLQQLSMQWYLSSQKQLAKIENIHGNWENYSIRGFAYFKKHDRWHPSKINLTFGENYFYFGLEEKHAWQTKISQLEILDSELKADIYAKGLYQQALQVSADVKQLQFKALGIAPCHIDIYLPLDQQSNTPIHILLKSTAKTRNSNNIHPYLRIQGNYQNHQVEFNIVTPDFKFYNRLNGQYRNKKWILNWNTSQAIPDQQTVWTLTQPVQLIVGFYNLNIPNISWVDQNNHQAKINIFFQLKKQKWEASLQATQLPLPQLDLNKGNLQGNVSLTAQLSGNPKKPLKGFFKLHLHPSRYLLPNTSFKQPIIFENGLVEAKLQDKTIDASWSLTQNQFNSVHGSMKIDDIQYIASKPKMVKIMGQCNIQAQDFQWFSKQLPEITDLKGKLTATTIFHGSVLKPHWNIDAKLYQGGLQLPDIGLRFQSLAAKFQGNQNKISIHAQSKINQSENLLNLEGYCLPKNKFSNQFKLFGNNVPLMQTEAYQFHASPNLQFTLDGFNHLHASGDIEINQGLLNLDKAPSQPVISPDIVLVDEEINLSTWHFSPNITLHTKKLQLIGYGFDATFAGKLQIEKPFDQFIGSGELTAFNGTYQLPGKRLFIHRGKILYPKGTLLTNPSLDLEMQQEHPHEKNISSTLNIANTTLYIHGNIENPKIEFNHKKNHLSSQDKAQTIDSISQAINASSSLLTNQIQSKLKLEELGLERVDYQHNIQDDPQKNTVFIIGKRLSSRIYLQYLKGILESSENESLNLIRLKYALNKHWALSLESGNLGQGVDINFNAKKD